MLRTKPVLTYNGLTVILSNPSRFDRTSLLTATGGKLFNELLRPEYNIGQCDIRLQEDASPFLSGTKCVLLLGPSAALHLLPQYKNNSLGEIRGLASYNLNGIPTLASFFPQDAADVKNYEKENNEQFSDDELDERDDETGDDKARHGRTKRSNYRFWLSKDIEKCKYLLAHNGKIPARPFEPEYIIYPSSELVVKTLQETKNEYLYFDMETDSELNMLCFSFSFSKSNRVYVIPCFDHNYFWAYGSLHLILRALTIAIRDNILVAHNGSAFDFFVLPYKYKIPLGKRLYDTMLAQHRCFPESEKSLGHTISLWAWYEGYHKDEGGSYSNVEQCRAMWSYCGKDVFTMRLCHMAIEEYARRQPGLQASIDQANDSIRPYLTTTLQGISYREDMLQATMKENDRLMMQYLRFIELLVGKDNLKTIRGTGKSSMPSSNVQCCRYFHDMLGYPVVARGQETKDGSRNPSLGKKAIFKLRLQYDNPVIDFVIAYREVQKESGSLKFNKWKD